MVLIQELFFSLFCMMADQYIVRKLLKHYWKNYCPSEKEGTHFWVFFKVVDFTSKTTQMVSFSLHSFLIACFSTFITYLLIFSAIITALDHWLSANYDCLETCNGEKMWEWYHTPTESLSKFITYSFIADLTTTDHLTKTTSQRPHHKDHIQKDHI